MLVKKYIRRPPVLLTLGILLGALLILGIRFITYKVDSVHYHANFAVFINGSREKFQGQQYYTPVTACAVHEDMTPGKRVHMHENVYDAIHVHDYASTWGQFFTNLGWYMGPDFIQLPDGTMYKDDGTNHLNLMLNGQDYTGLGGLANRVIENEDKLLVSFGEVSDDELQSEFKAITSSAHKFNSRQDPASCSGSEAVTWRDRLDHLF
jgi:hypothetical protein